MIIKNGIHFDPNGAPGTGEPGKPGAAPLLSSVKSDEPPAAVVPESYTFAKIGEGDKATDVPEADVKSVTEFAKANKLTQEQAQAFMNHFLTSKPVAVPETYTFGKIKNDKGEEVDVAEEITKPVSEFAKANKLTQEQAQAIVNREIELQAAANKAYAEQLDATVTQWREDARKDPVLGKGNFDANLGVAKKALDTFFPGLAKNVNDHYFLDHPMVLLGLYNIGVKLSEDNKVLPPGNHGVTPPSAAEIMFPSMKK